MPDVANLLDVSDDVRYQITTCGARPGPALLISFHIVVCCISLVYVSWRYQYFFNTSFESSRFYDASLLALIFALISPAFALARFSFGYFIGFYLYTIILGFLWLSYFTSLNYDHSLARISAVLSLVAFLLPSLFITSPLKPLYEMSETTLNRVLHGILVLAAGAVSFGASLNFNVVSIADIYNFRDEVQLPTTLQYLIGICTGALLPFSFACFATRGNYWRAMLVMVLLLLLYPITLSKLTLFAPVWLVGMAILSKFFEGRTATVLSLLVPVLTGLILIVIFPEQTTLYFGSINFRMLAIPSSALDYYSEFFSKHENTYFCQISILKQYANCPYQDPLSVVLARAYNLGNFNASLFATEGVASVGPVLAPIPALACGLVFALFNRISARLPSRFIVVSGAMMPQILLNVPFTTTLLTYGGGLLLVLWYLVPSIMFDRD